MLGLLRDKMKCKKKDQKGAALIMVIVAVAFIGMLVAMIIYMSFYNYQMKQTDKTAKDNFYSAETAMDIIHAGFQQEVSDAMSEAYVLTMRTSANMDESLMTQRFREYFLQILTKKVCANPAAAEADRRWKLSLIDGGKVSPAVDGYWQKDDSIKVSSDGATEGAYLATTNDDAKFFVGTTDMLLQNIKVQYMDNKGFVSIISTDIRLLAPDLEFAAAASKIDLEKYSIIADDRLTNSLAHNVQITGSVYGGKDGIYTDHSSTFTFTHTLPDTTIDSQKYALVANSLNSDNAKLVIDGNHDNYFNNINVSTSSLNMNGTTYVRDDLNIGGRASTVTLKGSYRGYGSSLVGAKNSSSILVNGSETVIDFTDLEELMLAGNAYVGATHYDADSDRNRYKQKVLAESRNETWNDANWDPTGSDYYDAETYDQIIADNANVTDGVRPYEPPVNPATPTISENSSDILMGESIAVKADQLLYMVPADCIGFVHSSHQQIFGKNPLTMDEYRVLTDETNLNTDGTLFYDLYDLSELETMLESTFHYSVKEVFRRVNGQVMVYLYLDFGDDQAEANRFFRTYTEKAKDSYNLYVKSYIKELRWGTKLQDKKNLTIAGNVFHKNSGAVDPTIVFDNIADDEEKQQNIFDRVDTYQSASDCMMSMLKDTPSDVTSSQLMKSVYENIVDEDRINSELGSTSGTVYTNGSIKAKIVKGDYTFAEADYNDNVKLLIATGDVNLNWNFDGLVIAGGDININQATCDWITYNETEVLNAMRAKNSDSGTDLYAYMAFGALGELSYAQGGSGSPDDRISLNECVIFDKWKKE